MRGDLGIRSARDDPVVLELAQPPGQRVRADARERRAQFGEALRTVQEFADHERGRRSFEQCEEARDPAFGQRGHDVLDGGVGGHNRLQSPLVQLM